MLHLSSAFFLSRHETFLNKAEACQLASPQHIPLFGLSSTFFSYLGDFNNMSPTENRPYWIVITPYQWPLLDLISRYLCQSEGGEKRHAEVPISNQRESGDEKKETSADMASVFECAYCHHASGRGRKQNSPVAFGHGGLVVSRS